MTAYQFLVKDVKTNKLKVMGTFADKKEMYSFKQGFEKGLNTRLPVIAYKEIELTEVTLQGYIFALKNGYSVYAADYTEDGRLEFSEEYSRTSCGNEAEFWHHISSLYEYAINNRMFEKTDMLFFAKFSD